MMSRNESLPADGHVSGAVVGQPYVGLRCGGVSATWSPGAAQPPWNTWNRPDSGREDTRRQRLADGGSQRDTKERTQPVPDLVHSSVPQVVLVRRPHARQRLPLHHDAVFGAQVGVKRLTKQTKKQQKSEPTHSAAQPSHDTTSTHGKGGAKPKLVRPFGPP